MGRHLPVTLGHEVVALVRETGPGSALVPGQRVAVRPGITCGRCPQCLDGRDELCPNRTRVGLERDGGLAELLAVPESQLHPLADEVPEGLAAVIEPMAIAHHALSRATGRLGASAVVGVGAIGLSVVALLAPRAVEDLTVIGTDVDRRLGNFDVAAAGGATAVEAGTEETERLKGRIDTVFLAAGSPAAAGQSLELLRPGGQLIVIGLGIGAVDVDFDAAVRREIHLIGSFGAARADWTAVVDLVNAGEVPDLGIASQWFDLADSEAAFAALRERTTRKAIVRIAGTTTIQPPADRPSAPHVQHNDRSQE